MREAALANFELYLLQFQARLVAITQNNELMAEQKRNQNRGVTFTNVCSSHAGFSTDEEARSIVAKEKQAYLDLVRRQVDQLNRRSAGGSAGYEPYPRNNLNQQSGKSRWGHRPGFCPDDISNSPSNANLAFDPYQLSGYNNDERDPWNLRPDGPCPNDPKKSGQSFPNPCTDRPDKSNSKSTTGAGYFKGNQGRLNESKSTVNLGTLPWNPNASPSSGTRINYNACDDRPGPRNRGNLLQEELLKAQSYCKRAAVSSQSASEICRARSQGRLRTPEISRINNSCTRVTNRVRSLAKLLIVILLVICLILLLGFVAYQLCTFTGFCGGGCKLEKSIHYVPY